MQNKKIYVTKPTLSSFFRIQQYSKFWLGEWDSYSQWSFGSEARKKEINDFLGVDNTVAVTNGTIALQIAIKSIISKG